MIFRRNAGFFRTVNVPSVSLLLCCLAVNEIARAEPKYSLGATDKEIKIGKTIPYSGPVSAWSTIGKAQLAYFRIINDRGSINGRKINLISLDDAYSSPKTVEQTRRLVESEEVLAIFGTVGIATNSAIQKYLNAKKVPQLFVVTGATKWGDPEHFPWTIGWTPLYKIEAQIYADYILNSIETPKVGILYQNDEYGKDYVRNFRKSLASRAESVIVQERTYEVGDPTIDSQIVSLKASGANVLLDITTPRFSAQAIRGVRAIGWDPIHIMNVSGTSIRNVLQVAGLAESKGLISATLSRIQPTRFGHTMKKSMRSNLSSKSIIPKGQMITLQLPPLIPSPQPWCKYCCNVATISRERTSWRRPQI